MGYKPTYGKARTSGVMKTKELAGKSSLFNLGKTNPINHNLSSGKEHTHMENSDKYTYQENVKPGTNRQSRSASRKLAKEMAAAANAKAEGFEGTQYNTEGYMRGGSSGKIELFQNGNILNANTGTRGGGDWVGAGSTDATYKKVRARDVRKQLRSTGSASISDGVISSGTTQTKTSTGSVKRDTRIADNAAKIEARRSELKNKKARSEGERARARLEKEKAPERRQAARKARQQIQNKKTNKQ